MVGNNILSEYQEVLSWIVGSNRWDNAAINEWNIDGKADPWLIATAKAYHQTIVTFDGGKNKQLPPIGAYSSKEPKISAVASQFDVRVITFYELFQELRFKM